VSSGQEIGATDLRRRRKRERERERGCTTQTQSADKSTDCQPLSRDDPQRWQTKSARVRAVWLDSLSWFEP